MLAVSHRYPALAVDFGCGGRVLVSGGLDGRTVLWDVSSGVQLRVLSGGGGGVRCARISPHRPTVVVTGTDDGIAPLWNLTDVNPEPSHVYGGHEGAVICCAWSADGQMLATGAASGELRLHTAPPLSRTLHHETDAHDLGVQTCEFSPLTEAESVHVLATAGCDSSVRLWAATEIGLRALCQFVAHGSGGATCLRWDPAGTLLVSAGADGWVRVWRVRNGAREVSALASVLAPGALTASPLIPNSSYLMVAIGTIGGGLALWKIFGEQPAQQATDFEEECAEARMWLTRGVIRWLREYVTRIPGTSVPPALEASLEKRVQESGLTGARLISDSEDELLNQLFPESASVSVNADKTGCKHGANSEDHGGVCGVCEEVRLRLRTELQWLRKETVSRDIGSRAPHSLLCPLTHRLMRDPVAASDGYTYERAAFIEWIITDGSGVSPMTGRLLSTRHVIPNRGARDLVQKYLNRVTDAPST